MKPQQDSQNFLTEQDINDMCDSNLAQELEEIERFEKIETEQRYILTKEKEQDQEPTFYYSIN